MPGKLYLIPVFIGERKPDMNFPVYNQEIVRRLNHFFVETPKPARQFLKSVNPEIDWDAIHFYHHDKHQRDQQPEIEFIRELEKGNDGGLLSDAGCPGVADPGSAAIALAHRAGIEVIPLIGPSSLLLTLMGSGLNGQQFSFLGYLPKEREQRTRELKRISQEILKTKATFLFIETPYRAHHMLEDILEHVQDSIVLCTGLDLMTHQQKVISKPIEQWKKDKKPKLEEKLVVFALGTQNND